MTAHRSELERLMRESGKPFSRSTISDKLGGLSAAALAHIDPADAERLIGDLLRAHLVDRIAPGRYAMHDLLRAYAAEQSDDAERATAARRLANHYLSAGGRRDERDRPAHRQKRPDVDSVTTPWTGEVEARAWLDAERANLLAFARAAAAAGNDDDVVRIAAITARYFDVAAYHMEAVDLHELAATAAILLADERAEANALPHLGFGSSGISGATPTRRSISSVRWRSR